MTEKRVQNELWWWLRQKGHDWIMPNFTPDAWFECDVFSITKSGCGVEYEIKLSKGDFDRDKDKSSRQTGEKYTALSRDIPSGPTRFYYVVPLDLLEKISIPDFAGVIVFAPRGKGLRFKEHKKAGKRHNVKVSDTMVDRIKTACYWRMWSIRQKNLEK